MAPAWSDNLDLLAMNGVLDFDAPSFVTNQNPRYVGSLSNQPSPFIGQTPSGKNLSQPKVDEFQYNKDDNRYECGIVIEASKRGKGYAKEGLKLLCAHAKKNGIKSLYDNFEKDRPGIEIFKQFGFKIYEETTWKKLKKKVTGIIVRKDF